MLNEPHARIVRHLCRDLGLLSEDQAVRLSGDGSTDTEAVVRELGGLVTSDLLRRERIIARVLPPLELPLVAWRPGDRWPDLAAVAWRAEKRWDVRPRVVTVYRAGPVGRRLFGHATRGAAQNLSSLSHDIACGELLLAFYRLAPERVRDWVGDAFRRPDQQRGEKLPDVVLQAPDQTPYLVCELTGVYPKSRLEAFHEYCADALRLPYELW
jgi:hypothetical protein